MINTALNKSDIFYLLSQQDKLDESMRKTHLISKYDWLKSMRKEHKIALKVEVHEWINECYEVWKYWKKKPMDTAKILEEAIDVIHFVMLDLNKSELDTEEVARQVAGGIDVCNKLKNEDEVKDLMYRMSTGSLYSMAYLVCVLQILDYYGFNSQNIIHCYNEKNRENFRRLASGY